MQRGMRNPQPIRRLGSAPSIVTKKSRKQSFLDGLNPSLTPLHLQKWGQFDIGRTQNWEGSATVPGTEYTVV